MDQTLRSQFQELFESQIPLHRHLGLKLLDLRPGYVKFQMPFNRDFIGDFRVDRWHGGAVALLMDVAGGSAAMTTLQSVDEACATVDIRVDYLRPATNHDVVAEAEVIRRGSSIVVTEMTIVDAESDVMLARGTGVFNVKRTTAPEA